MPKMIYPIYIIFILIKFKVKILISNNKENLERNLTHQINYSVAVYYSKNVFKSCTLRGSKHEYFHSTFIIRAIKISYT